MKLIVPKNFKPPIVKKKERGIDAFHAYDWYFNYMRSHLENVESVFLVPCAATKPIHNSVLHKRIYQKHAKKYGKNREVLVVSEPVVLIGYQDLYDLEEKFLYDFPPKLLNPKSREFFVSRLNKLLDEKDISGCLPKHHARLINDAIGTNWENYWEKDLFEMMRRASKLN